jgi:hypothetical protein
MARYDSGGYGGYRSGYGRERAPSWEWSGGPAAPGYDRDHGGSMTGIYGPSRYGLGPYHERLRTRRRPDDEVREDVEEALFYDTWVDADAITVEVKDGIVTLLGDLPDYEEIRYATDDAWDVDGVLGVRSQLKVRE